MATKLPDDLSLAPLDGEARGLSEWLTTFHLASVVLDPYTNESSWILKTAVRILEEFRGSDARVNFIVTADQDDAHAFLGPLTERFLVFCDPDRSVVRAMGLEQLPAFVFTRVDREVVVAVARGGTPPSGTQSPRRSPRPRGGTFRRFRRRATRCGFAGTPATG